MHAGTVLREALEKVLRMVTSPRPHLDEVAAVARTALETKPLPGVHVEMVFPDGARFLFVAETIRPLEGAWPMREEPGAGMRRIVPMGDQLMTVEMQVRVPTASFAPFVDSMANPALTPVDPAQRIVACGAFLWCDRDGCDRPHGTCTLAQGHTTRHSGQMSNHVN